MALSPDARHALARARAELGSVQARAAYARCPHGGTRGRCRLCLPADEQRAPHGDDAARGHSERLLVDQ